MAKIVAVMACPTGIAHTVMAAEALEKTAKIMGHTLRAEMLRDDRCHLRIERGHHLRQLLQNSH